MNILVLTNSDILSGPTLKYLLETNQLGGVGFVQSSERQVLPMLEGLGLGSDHTLSLKREDWVKVMTRFIEERQIQSVWVLTFPWIIPSKLLEISDLTFVNFHFGLLPKYKGADPIFWQLKNREQEGGVTIHLMSEQVDEGPILLQKKLRIIPGENYGLHCKRLGETNKEYLDELFEKLNEKDQSFLTLESEEALFDRKPSEQDLSINWSQQSAEEIEWLVNAANPKYQGARTSIAGIEIRILEVTPVNMEQSVEANPGQIVHADVVYGIVVACRDQEYLRITVVQTSEGYLSGVKLFNLGFLAGHSFAD
ncbi:methionyl-tRNA formyltransferase [Roseivirga sp.]|uniref:methionyl-tRNA formyltransferase n=1 Tax=Roseivirga sp. TaxID=1964215 RepID=UPI003B51EF13